MTDTRSSRTIVIAGGGTGGHVFPGVAVARELRRRDPRRSLLWIGARAGMESRIVPAEGFPLVALPLGGLAGKSASARIQSGLLAAMAVARCVWRFAAHRPAAVLGVGGFASGPAGLAAALTGVPLFVHEQNSIPGGTNRFLARLARAVAVSFPETASLVSARSVVVTGNPVRAEFFEQVRGREESAASEPRRAAGGRSLLVIGGSRGARSINKAVSAALPRLGGWRDRLRIVHQSGQADLEEVRAAHEASGFDSEVAAFFDDMPVRMRDADLVLCRSGASTVFELAAAGRPSLLVPFPYAAADHQTANARSLESAGGAVVMRDSDLSGESLAAALDRLLSDPVALRRMAQASRALARPDAAARIADLLEAAAADRAVAAGAPS